MKNKPYLIYAVVVTVIVTVMCWINMFDSFSETRGNSSSGGYRSSGSYGGSGGHK